MFGLLTIRRFKIAMGKIYKDIRNIFVEIKDLKVSVVSKEKIELMIENALLKSQSQPVSISLKKSQNNIETKIINKVRRGKKALVMAEISKLKPSLSIIEIFNIIVLERGLCSKASFYRYVASLKSQSQVSVSSPRTKQTN